MRVTSLAGGVVGVCAVVAIADIPTYTGFEIQVGTSDINFNLPVGGSINSATPVINNHDEIAIKAVLPGASGIWAGSEGIGGMIATDSVAFFREPTINDAGLVVWEQDAPTNGLYAHDLATQATSFYGNRPLGTGAWTGRELTEAGKVGFRALFTGNDHGFFLFDPVTNSAAEYALERGLDPASPYSFLFTPQTNNADQIASKVLLVAGGNQIRLFDGTTNHQVIVSDSTADPASPHATINNGIDLNDAGQIAFAGRLVAGGNGVFITDGTTTTTIATTNDAILSSIDFFAPAINNDGLVVFRGRDATNTPTIFVGDGTSLIKLISEGDPLTGPNGESLFAGRLIDTSNPFGGAPAINDAGSVVFSVQVNDGNDLLGTGVFIAQALAPTCPADLTTSADPNNPGFGVPDGTLDANDFFFYLGLFAAGDLAADLTGSTNPNDPGFGTPDGVLDANDFFFYLQLFAQGCP